jgi:hypothetical protein
MGMSLVGKTVKEVATQSIIYQSCQVLDSDTVGLTIQVERTITEEGDVETVVSQIMIPWAQVQHVIIAEEHP